MTENDAVATVETAGELTRVHTKKTIVPLTDITSAILKPLRVGADGGRKTSLLDGLCVKKGKTMDVREKLIDILLQKPNKCTFEQLADFLIAHGVTVQEWISVKDRLPEEEEKVLIYTKTGIVNYGTYTKRYGFDCKEGFVCSDGFMWLSTASHWQPMPQPPKGE